MPKLPIFTAVPTPNMAAPVKNWTPALPVITSKALCQHIFEWMTRIGLLFVFHTLFFSLFRGC